LHPISRRTVSKISRIIGHIFAVDEGASNALVRGEYVNSG